MEKIPTAEEFLNRDKELIEDIIDGKVSYSIALNTLENKLIEFAKLHVKATLEDVKESCINNNCRECGGNEYFLIDKDSIFNAYPEENIK